MLKRRHYPDPPEGAAIVRADGSRVPVELVYEGRRDGLHHWTATGELRTGDTLHVDRLPPHTSIAVRVDDVAGAIVRHAGGELRIERSYDDE